MSNFNLRKSGTSSVTSIRNTCNCQVHADSSHLLLHNSTNLKLNVTDSSVSLQNDTNFTATGKRNRISGRNLTNGSVGGEGNAVAAKNTTNLRLNGTNVSCELSNETNTSLVGIAHVISASGNTNLGVSGTHNNVVAFKNTNLKVKGDQSKVFASNTTNISVHGELNQVSAQNTGMSHQLQRIPPGSLRGNEVDISGSACHNIYYQHGGINIVNGVVQSNGGINIVNGVVQSSGTPIRGQVAPKLSIWYVDGAAINQGDYQIGLFRFQLERLWDPARDNYSTCVSVEVITTELDGGSYSSILSLTGDYVLICGKKDGVEQTLKVIGNRVSRADADIKNKFVVDFNPDLKAMMQ